MSPQVIASATQYTLKMRYSGLDSVSTYSTPLQCDLENLAQPLLASASKSVK